MVLDLADLSTVKPAVERFLAMEDRLHVLVHNAGVMMPAAGSKTKLVSLWEVTVRRSLVVRRIQGFC